MVEAEGAAQVELDRVAQADAVLGLAVQETIDVAATPMITSPLGVRLPIVPAQDGNT